MKYVHIKLLQEAARMAFYWTFKIENVQNRKGD